MQINLNEADIKLAIEKHVRAKVNFESDVEIVIDLKATRGPEGFTATIDLDETPVKSETEKAARTPRKAAAPTAAEEKVVTLVAKQETPAAETAQGAADEPAGTEATDAPADAGAVEQAADAAETGQPETTDAAADSEAEAAVPEKPRSLFSNLAKPKN